MSGTVIFLGAGATKSCGGPMTQDILPQMLAAAGGSPDSALLYDFFENLFHVHSGSPAEQFPSLPLVMSLLDLAIDRRQAFHPDWDLQRISDLRQAVELQLFDLLEEQLFRAPTNNHWSLLKEVYREPARPCVISTNYDLIVDTAMMAVSQGSPTKDACRTTGFNYATCRRSAMGSGSVSS